MHFTIYRIIIIHFHLTPEPNLLYKSMIGALKNFAVNHEKNYDPRHAGQSQPTTTFKYPAPLTV